MVMLMLESSGIPIINTTLLLLTGALASLSRLDIRLLAISAIVGSTAGACSAYYIGACGGRRIFLRMLLLFHIDAHKIHILDYWFQRSGVWMVFFSRMTPYVRPFACFPAGISRMPFVRFLVSALAGSVIWCSVMLSVGWYLGLRWKVAMYAMQHYTLPTLGILILLVTAYILIMHMIKHHLNFHFADSSDVSHKETRNNSRDLLNV